MPTIRRRNAAVAVGAKVNPLVGSQYEYLPFNALVEAAITSDIAGAEATFFSGTDVILEDSPVPVKATEPVYPDDYDVRDVAAQGERLGLTIRNATGAGVAVFTTVVKITPL